MNIESPFLHASTRRTDRGRVTVAAGKGLTVRVRTTSLDDEIAYHRTREDQERRAQSDATDMNAATVHGRLAALHAYRVQMLESSRRRTYRSRSE